MSNSRPAQARATFDVRVAAGHAVIQPTAKLLAVLGAAHAPARSCSVVHVGRGEVLLLCGRGEVGVELQILHVTERKAAHKGHTSHATRYIQTAATCGKSKLLQQH